MGKVIYPVLCLPPSPLVQLVVPIHAPLRKKVHRQRNKPEWSAMVINRARAMELVGDRRLINARVLFAVSSKVTAGAKSFGSFFSGVANKAGAKIKETVKDNVS